MDELERRIIKEFVLVIFVFIQCIGITAHGEATSPVSSCEVKAQPSWSEIEEWVWERLCAGKMAYLSDRDDRPPPRS